MRRNHAFTLVELLVAAGILAVLGMGMTAILRSGIFTWRQGEARTYATTTALSVLDQVGQDLGAAFTRNLQPPGPVTIEIPTVKEMYRRITVDGNSYLSNEWCDVAWEFNGIGPDPERRYLHGSDGSSATFTFRLAFKTRKARVWLAASSGVQLEAQAWLGEDGPQGMWREASEWPSGDISHIIDTAADHIAVSATLENSSALLMPGPEGPVLRFTAEPDAATLDDVRFLLAASTGEPQKAVFVRNFSRRASNPFLQTGDETAGSLGEVCYVVTFNEETPGTRSATGTLWRAARQPLGNWLDGPVQPYEPAISFFEREFINDISLLSEPVQDGGGGTARIVYPREKMMQAGFYPIAENVLHFAIEAWDESSGIPQWSETWSTEHGSPKKVRIVLVVQPQGSGMRVARLMEDLDASTVSPEIALESAIDFRYYSKDSSLHRFVKIDEEWMYYDDVRDGRKLMFDPADNSPLANDRDRPNSPNRGLRTTAAAAHAVGADVLQGETYVREIMLPSPRQPVEDSEENP